MISDRSLIKQAQEMLTTDGLGVREIARRLKLPHSTVSRFVRSVMTDSLRIQGWRGKRGPYGQRDEQRVKKSEMDKVKTSGQIAKAKIKAKIKAKDNIKANRKAREDYIKYIQQTGWNRFEDVL
jgi:IS30 family transposase